jgi:hypothetical protein
VNNPNCPQCEGKGKYAHREGGYTTVKQCNCKPPTQTEPKLSWTPSGYLMIDKAMTTIFLPSSVRALELNYGRSLIEAAFMRGYREAKGAKVPDEHGALSAE